MGENQQSGTFRALIVDDEPLYAQAIERELQRQQVVCDLAYTAGEAVALTQSQTYHAILLDHRLPDDDGIRIIPLLLARQAGASLVMMTAFETIPNAIRAIRQGAEDYLVKQTSVKPIVDRVLEIRNLQQVRLQVKGWREDQDQNLLGESPAIHRVREQIRKVAQSPETTVLITGETGAGKEVAAREIHRQSASAGQPFVTVDCLALPDKLVESLLFGHEKGAFTSAESAREGAFAEAGEGTLFLDEIGEMDLSLQGKLLRVLESRTFQRVGSVSPQPVRARVMAATNRDLRREAEKGGFRFDLFQRLAVFPLDVPPLSERLEDVSILAHHFMDVYCARLGNPNCRIAPEVLDLLQGYDYPGNVRELRNIIERAVIMAEGTAISRSHLPERLLQRQTTESAAERGGEGVDVDFIAGVDTLETVEKKMIIQALRQSGGVKSEAAELLGISRYQLLRRIEKYNL